MSQRNARILSGRRGFSLPELIVVMVIVATLAVVAVPRMSQSITRQRVDATARRIVADLEYARRLARLHGVDRSVAFAEETGRYLLADVPNPDHPSVQYRVDLWREPYLLQAIIVDFDGSDKVTFSPFGQPDSGGTVKVRIGRFAATVWVDANTGQISTNPATRLASPDLGVGEVEIVSDPDDPAPTFDPVIVEQPSQQQLK